MPAKWAPKRKQLQKIQAALKCYEPKFSILEKPVLVLFLGVFAKTSTDQERAAGSHPSPALAGLSHLCTE